MPTKDGIYWCRFIGQSDGWLIGDVMFNEPAGTRVELLGFTNSYGLDDLEWGPEILEYKGNAI